MNLVKKSDINKVEAITKQGYEPNSKNLTKEYLYEKLNKKRLPIKTLLLDQTIISGLGNIYADEVLFEAKINPLKSGENISINECQKIIDAANKIIKKAIENGGTTIKSYTSSLGVRGRFQQYLQVHKRENENCYICNNKIIKIKVGGRSTYYCNKCQK
jgi:formamidopyrimidine-DNA glycosylase